MRRVSIFLAASLLLCGAMPVLAATQEKSGEHTRLLLDDLRTFTDVFNLVRNNYVDEVGDHELLDSALRGMVKALDPHSEFLEPIQAQDQDEQAQGRFGGIGVAVDVRDGQIYISAVSPDGPADRAGAKAGDQIIAVDGRPVRGRPIQASLDDLRGVPGTQVALTLVDRTLTVTRAYIPVPSVYPELLDSAIAYFQITHFHVNSGQEFRQALERMTQNSPQALEGIVIDLRGNGGGVVGAAVVIADGFLDDGLVVFTQGRKPRPQIEYFAQPGQWAADVPVAVLIDRRTASASEILAGALQDHGRAVLIGEASYGKGTVQTVLALRNGSALKLTTSRYYTPEGRSIDQSGISPDVLAAVATGADDDPPLDKALELLTAKIP